ncbi:MAG: thiol-disulfide isomerase/thioredoxin [Verrucomicrobiales bacterium]|jgi:thiol-disulfide isomerase/thioredoxin
MAETSSTFELKRGAQAPDFDLPVGGMKKRQTLEDLSEGNDVLVVIFACNHCPYVIHLADSIGEVAKDYDKEPVQFVAINSNDAGSYPDDSPDLMKDFTKKHGWKFPYLFDETQHVAKAYSAACTPDFYVFNKDKALTYAGQFDGSRPGNHAPITGSDLISAIEATLRTGKANGVQMRPSLGCNIKWKRRNKPPYARWRKGGSDAGISDILS